MEKRSTLDFSLLKEEFVRLSKHVKSSILIIPTQFLSAFIYLGLNSQTS